MIELDRYHENNFPAFREFISAPAINALDPALVYRSQCSDIVGLDTIRP
jgi:hypothetical protein